jgi:predicted GNAT family acetyltransferase
VLPDEICLDEPEHRYEITTEGELAGFVTYRDHGGTRTLLHTEIDPAFEGRGLASRLIRAVLDDLREKGLGLLPVCPFVRAFLDKQPEYVALVPPAQRARFDLAPAVGTDAGSD